MAPPHVNDTCRRVIRPRDALLAQTTIGALSSVRNDPRSAARTVARVSPRAFPQTLRHFSCEGGWRAQTSGIPTTEQGNVDTLERDRRTHPAVPPSVRADRVIVRRFDPAFDSYAQLTPMLHRAFARLGAMGLNCTCVDQSEDVTRRRAEAGECYVAVCGGRVIGTATLYATDPSSACSLYRREGVASVRQVAVDPDCQSRGIGALLLAFAEQCRAARLYAARTRYAAPASHLLAFYGAQGFRRRRRDALRRQALRQRDPLQAACRPPRAARRRRRAWPRAWRPCGVLRMRCRRAWSPLPGAASTCAVAQAGRHDARPVPRVAARRRGVRVSTGAIRSAERRAPIRFPALPRKRRMSGVWRSRSCTALETPRRGETDVYALLYRDAILCRDLHANLHKMVAWKTEAAREHA